MSEPAKKESSTRWWEFYTVRYAMGTVVGAIIFFLWSRPDGFLHPILFGAATAESLETSVLIMLASAGLVYCYIASAPILVFHAGRFLLLNDKLKKFINIMSACLFVAAVVATVIYCYLSGADIAQKLLTSVAVYILIQILFLQGMIVYHTVSGRREMYHFYVQLAKRRNQDNNKGEILDSYRHLREHGNSFFILFLELMLAIVLFGLKALVPEPPATSGVASLAPALPLVALVFWVAPAVSVWLIATYFERQFTDDPQAPGQAQTNASANLGTGTGTTAGANASSGSGSGSGTAATASASADSGTGITATASINAGAGTIATASVNAGAGTTATANVSAGAGTTATASANAGSANSGTNTGIQPTP